MQGVELGLYIIVGCKLSEICGRDQEGESLPAVSVCDELPDPG